MFGTFSMSYGNQSITGKSKSNESNFITLMEALLHAGKEGIARDALEQAIFQNIDLKNIHHSTQNVIYNAKKQLLKYGLPDVNFIEQKEGVYYFTDEIPVVEDAREFDRLFKLAEEEKDKTKKMNLYLDVIHLYDGEFLEHQASVVWIAKEARRYRELFCESVEKAAELLREKEEWFVLEDLGYYAAKVHPFAEWETLTMEALIATSRYEEAIRFYEDISDYYMSVIGLRPSARMQELMDYLGDQINHSYEVLDEIQEKLMEEDPDAHGGYACSYPIFRGIYQLTERTMERGGQSVFLMLCTLVDSKGNPMRDNAQMTELTDRLKDAIFRSIRRSDVVCRYGKGQYLVLLANTTMENCKIVQKRINQNFLIGRQRTGVQYYVNSVFCRYD
ncbi:MAG: hypothetical protein IKG00_07645 [Lachnospiraceae bacterium]|nr:hypothetical protein [Lachnospiraceae bacterium]